jgi:hypothetical protein
MEQPRLRARMVTMLEVDARDVERCIDAEYGHSFVIEADQELRSDDIIRMTIERGKLDERDQQRVADYRETGKGTFLLRDLLGELCDKGYIPEGTYLIAN